MRSHITLSTFFLSLLLPHSPALSPTTFVILGGTGRIGTAIASHLLLRTKEEEKPIQIILVGRDEQRGHSAVQEVLQEQSSSSSTSTATTATSNVLFEKADWKNQTQLQTIVSMADCLIHTAGPYLDELPGPLQEAIASDRCKAYVDVSDPLEFLEASLHKFEEAKESGTSALIAAGAFPGMSNVLAMEAASAIRNGRTSDEKDIIKDVRFNYFTAGLGGSGDVNLFITNIGFGEPQVQFENGALRFYQALSGLLLGKVNFFLPESDILENPQMSHENRKAQARIGTQTVFAWPFPEAATVARQLEITGESSAAMGTAPDLWNTMLGILVSLVPRPLWRSRRFSKWMADFSQPLVKLTDGLLKLTSPDNVGETHAMRVDVTGINGNVVSCVQAHESFRRCVGQSCAEFALDLLRYPSPGVYLPEQRYEEDPPRMRIIEKLTNTPGTIAYTGPAFVKSVPSPTKMREALHKANELELEMTK